jgi:hypothetical protein
MAIFYQSDQEIETLVQSFSDKTLDKSLWTHAAHLTVAIWHLKNYDLHEATCRMKSGIISYNLAVGGQNTGTGGYHETMTLFWMDILQVFVNDNPDLPVNEACNKLLNSKLSDKTLPFVFYNKEYILSPAARARAMAPDLLQLTPENVLQQAG